MFESEYDIDPSYEEPILWTLSDSPKLKRAMERYIASEPLTDSQVFIIKIYLIQFINSTAWKDTDEVLDLRVSVQNVSIEQDLRDWIKDAIAAGIDPL